MDKRKFSATIDTINKNLELINDILKTSDESLLSNPKRVERAKYFFISAIQSLLNLCNEYIDNKSWRTPINAMDVFIVLSEYDIITKENVPILKKAVACAPTINRLPNNESLTVMRECTKGIGHCVAAYRVLIQTGDL